MSAVLKLEGQKFGRLTVLSKSDKRVKKHVCWVCQCECGKITEVIGSHLLDGSVVSCGCYQKEQTSKCHKKHGKHDSRIYHIWCAMKSRCHNPNNQDYKDYGGRGITVCKEWNENFNAFWSWAIENGYSNNLPIDRINTNGNYCPENCRWADDYQQANNHRNTLIYNYNGETHSLSEWARMIGISPNTLYCRIVIYKWPIERAMTEKNNKKRKDDSHETD